MDKILIIDDSSTFLLHVKGMLEDKYQVHTIDEPKSAIIVAERVKPDLIITDLEMPGLNGNDICSLLKSHSFLNTVPVFLFTGRDSTEKLQIEAVTSGADDVLSKSATKELLCVKVESFLRKRRIHKKQIKEKQIEATQAMLVSFNHEFNNLLTINGGTVARIAKKNTDESLAKYISSLLKCNDRMTIISNKMKELKTIEYDEYDDSTLMVKL